MAKKDKNFDYRLVEVQEAGNNLLRTTISDLRNTLTDVYWIAKSEEDQKDKGIDFQYELEDKFTGKTIHLFKIQNKGTETSLKPLKTSRYKGFISFQLKLRNAIYYRQEIPLPLIFTISDVADNKVYWHPVQLDDEIDERINHAEQAKKDSIQIYIDPKNVLSSLTVERFIKDVINSFKQQYSRFNNYSYHRLFVIDEKHFTVNRALPIIDQLFEYFQHIYKELNFVPIHLLKNNYPFKDSNNFFPDYSIFNLSTDNEELFKLFDSLKIENEKVSTSEEEFANKVESSDRKLIYILQKLSGNLVFNIGFKYSGKNIDIQYTNEEHCNCVRCSFNRLDYSNAFRALKISTKSIEDKLLFAYMHYEFGNYIKSARYFQEIAIEAKKNNQKVRYLITQYNLSKLYIFIRNHYWGENDQTELLENLKAIDLDRVCIDCKTDENSKMLDWIINSKFFYTKKEKINRTVDKIRDHYYTQLIGGASSNNSIGELITEYAEIETFISRNYIVFNKFNEYLELTEKFIEGLIISHAINEKQSARLKYFDDWLISCIIFNGNAERILKHFNRYELKTLKYKQNSKIGDSFIDILNNHLKNYESLRTEFETSCEKSNLVFWERYNSIFSNLILLASICDIESIQVKSIAHNLLLYLNHETFINHTSIKFVRLFIIQKGEIIEKSDLYGFLKLYIEKGKYHTPNFAENIIDQILKKHKPLSLNKGIFNKLLSFTFSKCDLCGRQHPPDLIAYLYDNVENSSTKSIIRSKIENSLDNNFDDRLYYISGIYNVFDTKDKYFVKFIESVKPKSGTVNHRSIFFGIEENRFPKVNELINLCFKYEIDLTDKLFDDFKGLDEYYSWLFNMEYFDYNKFNPKWIVEYDTIYFIRQFKKFPIIGTKVLDYLKNNSDTRLEKFVLNLFSEDIKE